MMSSFCTASSPINIGDPLPERKRLSKAIFIIGRSVDYPASFRLEDSTSCSDEEFLIPSTDSETSSLIERPMNNLRNIEILEREGRLEIREEEMESRMAIANMKMQASQLLGRPHGKNGFTNGSAPRDLGREDIARRLAQLIPLDAKDRTLAVARLEEQLLRVQMQVDAEHGVCVLLHQAIAGIESILDQKHYEHASRLENYQRVTMERLRHCTAANALIEDHSRELMSALREEQRFRIQSEDEVKALKEARQHLLGLQQQLVADRDELQAENGRLGERLAAVEEECRDLRAQVEGHKLLEHNLAQEIIRLEQGAPEPSRRSREWGCAHQ